MRRTIDGWLTVLIGSVWIFHGLYSKLLSGIPRHRLIVERVLGAEAGPAVTMAVGGLEVLMGLWVFTRKRRVACVVAQTLAITVMNSLEIILAKDLLIFAPGMVALNLVFLSLAWYWAVISRGLPQ